MTQAEAPLFLEILPSNCAHHCTGYIPALIQWFKQVMECKRTCSFCNIQRNQHQGVFFWNPTTTLQVFKKIKKKLWEAQFPYCYCAQWPYCTMALSVLCRTLISFNKASSSHSASLGVVRKKGLTFLSRTFLHFSRCAPTALNVWKWLLAMPRRLSLCVMGR